MRRNNSTKRRSIVYMAVQIKPQYAEAHNNLAVILHALGNTEGAFQHAQTAVDIDENYAMAHSNLGAVFA